MAVALRLIAVVPFVGFFRANVLVGAASVLVPTVAVETVLGIPKKFQVDPETWAAAL